MKEIKTLILILTIFISGQSFAQLSLAEKVYESGSKTHFNNFKKCDFYFECDCCSGKLIFTNSSNYLLINYCMSDFVVTKGAYKVSSIGVILSSDGSRIDVKYNWEREVNPNAKPDFFVKDSTVSKYQLNYKIDHCERTMLVSQDENGTLVAIETDLLLSDELELLKKFQLEELLYLK